MEEDVEFLSSFTKRLENLIQNYKFNLQTISIICNIEFNRLNLFYKGEKPLTYDETNLIEEVFIGPFESAISISKENYDMFMDSLKIEKILLKDYIKEK